MRVRFNSHPLLERLMRLLVSLLAPLLFCLSILLPQVANAEVINIPLQRVIATQPITSLEIISIVKSLLSGRVLSIKKQSSYSNPDCHTVKFLEDKGEFQVIKVGCFTDKIAQNKL